MAVSDLESQVDMHTYVDACTFSYKGVGHDKGWLKHAYLATQRHIFVPNSVKGLGKKGQVRWTCIYVLVYVEGTKQLHTYLCIAMQRAWTGLGIQVVMHTCSDASTPSCQGMELDKGPLEHAHNLTGIRILCKFSSLSFYSLLLLSSSINDF